MKNCLIKNRYLLTIVTILLFGLLTGCGAAVNNENTEKSTPEPTADGQNIQDAGQEGYIQTSQSNIPEEEEQVITPEPTEIPVVQAESSWEEIHDIKVSHTVNIEGFYSRDYGITVGYAGASFYTTDGGETWTKGTNTSMCRFCLDIVDENLAWSAGNGKNVRVTKDNGQNWTAVKDTTCLETAHLNIEFIDDQTGWVCTHTKLASTADGGKTWTEMTIPEGVKRISAIYLRTAQDGYLLAQDGTLYITKDGGTSWETKKIDPSEQVAMYPNSKFEFAREQIPVVDFTFTDENNGTVIFTCPIINKDKETWVATTTDGGETWEYEKLMFDDFKAFRVYISADGKYLTLGAKGRMKVLERR